MPHDEALSLWSRAEFERYYEKREQRRAQAEAEADIEAVRALPESQSG